jgi:hypothetical protein
MKINRMKTGQLKPLNKYKGMTQQEKMDAARSLLGSIRGSLVLGQACAVASKELMATEPSNAEDIALIGEMFFNPCYAMCVAGRLYWGSGEDLARRAA